MLRIVLACLILVSPALATAMDISASVQAGSKGIGLHLYTPLHPNMTLRVGPNFYNDIYNSRTSYTEYDAHLRLRTIDALLDWHPFAGGFRVTSGIVVNNTTIRLDARPDASGSITIGNRTYSISDIGAVNGEIYFRRYAPYLGIGWGQAGANTRRGWHFQGDLGIIFPGTSAGLAAKYRLRSWQFRRGQLRLQ